MQEMKDKELARELLIKEFEMLNGDIQRRLADRFYLTFGTLGVAGSLMGISGIPGYVLFLFPWACYLVSLWILHNEISVKRKNVYIREIEKAYFPDGFGFLTAKSRLNFGKLNTDKLNIETVVNTIIVGAEVATIAIGALRLLATPQSWLIYIASVVLLLASGFGVWKTWQSDFVRYAKKAEAAKK